MFKAIICLFVFHWKINQVLRGQQWTSKLSLNFTYKRQILCYIAYTLPSFPSNQDRCLLKLGILNFFPTSILKRITIINEVGDHKRPVWQTFQQSCRIWNALENSWGLVP